MGYRQRPAPEPAQSNARAKQSNARAKQRNNFQESLSGVIGLLEAPPATEPEGFKEKSAQLIQVMASRCKPAADYGLDKFFSKEIVFQFKEQAELLAKIQKTIGDCFGDLSACTFGCSVDMEHESLQDFMSVMTVVEKLGCISCPGFDAFITKYTSLLVVSAKSRLLQTVESFVPFIIKLSTANAALDKVFVESLTGPCDDPASQELQAHLQLANCLHRKYIAKAKDQKIEIEYREKKSSVTAEFICASIPLLHIGKTTCRLDKEAKDLAQDHC